MEDFFKIHQSSAVARLSVVWGEGKVVRDEVRKTDDGLKK